VALPLQDIRMNTKELIHKIEKSRTKDDLEALGIEYLDVDVDKRKSKEILRAELLTLAEQREGFEEGEPSPQPTPAKAEQPPKGRMGRNKRTGRVMPWTAAMAKYSNMEEV
jgi:hypothetical protein